MGDRISEPRDAYTIGLALLGARELSEAQLRSRLLRRRCDPDDVEQAIERLKRDRTLDDRRVARAAARLEASVRHRGPVRVLQRIRQLGIDAEIAKDAVGEVFADVDEMTLLDRAIERHLRSRPLEPLDRVSRAKLVRALVAKGFRPSAIYERLRTRCDRDLEED
jgi:regulatory protein